MTVAAARRIADANQSPGGQPPMRGWEGPRPHKCRMSDGGRAHIHALLGIFHRSLMATMTANSTASFRYQDKPAEYAIVNWTVSRA
jgi:hypothetical protein